MTLFFNNDRVFPVTFADDGPLPVPCFVVTADTVASRPRDESSVQATAIPFDGSEPPETRGKGWVRVVLPLATVMAGLGVRR